MLDLIDVGVHAIDENGHTVVYNKKMMEIESLKRSDVLHKNVLDFFAFQDEMHSTLVQARVPENKPYMPSRRIIITMEKKLQRLTIHIRSFETVSFKGLLKFPMMSPSLNG
ncbi:PAS domain-containing protein [Bacillus sp. SL00103]